MFSKDGSLRFGAAPTRRAFLTRAAGTGLAAGALSGTHSVVAAATTRSAACQPVDPGTRIGAVAVTPAGRTVWVTDGASTTITAVSARTLARKRSVDVGGTPIDLAILPDGRRAVVLTAFYDRPSLVLVSLTGGGVAHRFDVGRQPASLALSHDGRHAYVTGRDGTLTAVSLTRLAVGTPTALGAGARGIALHPHGSTAAVALHGDAALALVDLRLHRVVATIPTAPYPYDVAISHDGALAVVTHAGVRANRATVIELARRRVVRKLHTGTDPGAVALSRDGRTAAVADYGGAAVTLINIHDGRRRTVGVGHRPRGLAIAPKGDRLFAASEFEGTVSAIRLPKVKHA